jgi:transposase
MTMGKRTGRRNRSTEEKRRIVEESLVGCVSVSQVALAHDVNAAQLHQWRRLYRGVRLEKAAVGRGTLLRVQVADSGTAPGTSRAARPGIIDIDLGHARVRIEGAADPAAVRAALEGLLR